MTGWVLSVLRIDGHYLLFDQAFTRDTTEQDHPSLKGNPRQSLCPLVQVCNTSTILVQ